MKGWMWSLALLVSGSVWAQDWELLTVKENGDAVYFKPNSEDTAWIKIESKETKYYDKRLRKNQFTDGKTVVLFRFDCDDRQFGLVSYHVYNSAGEVVESESQNKYLAKMEYVVPDTTGEYYLDTFCAQ